MRWLTEGEPLIRVEEPLRGELLAVKRGEVPLDEVMTRAEALTQEMERAFATTRLPREPDYEAAHRFVLRCRQEAAAAYLRQHPGRVTGGGPAHAPPQDGSDRAATPVGLAPARFDVPMDRLRAFVKERFGDLDFAGAPWGVPHLRVPLPGQRL